MLIVWSGNWWALAMRAGVAILLGIIALTLPGPTLAAIVILFGVYAIIDGVLALIAAIRGLKRQERRGTMMAQGIVGIIAGVFAFAWPAIGALALVYLVGAWALLTGVLEIAMAIKLRKIIKGEWLMIVGGILSIALAIMIGLFPGIGATVLIWWLGAYALVYGAFTLALAFRVRNYIALHPDGGDAGLRPATSR